MQGEGDEAQQGAEGRRQDEAEGDLRGHAGRGPVRGLGLSEDNPKGARAPGAPMGHAEKRKPQWLTKP